MPSTTMEQRRFTRYRLQAGFTGITATTEDGRRIDGHAHDLCEGGVQIEIDDSVRDHERLEVEIELPGATVARSPARVAWRDEETGRIGLRFESLAPSEHARICRWLGTATPVW